MAALVPVYVSFAQRMAVTELMLDLVTKPGLPTPEVLAPNQHDHVNARVILRDGDDERSWLIDANGVITDEQSGAVNHP